MAFFVRQIGTTKILGRMLHPIQTCRTNWHICLTLLRMLITSTDKRWNIAWLDDNISFCILNYGIPESQTERLRETLLFQTCEQNFSTSCKTLDFAESTKLSGTCFSQVFVNTLNCYNNLPLLILRIDRRNQIGSTQIRQKEI